MKAISQDLVAELISRWREDADGTYRNWFLWEKRLKNFRAIRQGLKLVTTQIAAGQFGTAYRERLRCKN